MAISVRLHDCDLQAPDGAVIGIIGADGAGKTTLLKSVGKTGKYLGPLDRLEVPDAAVLAIDETFALHDAIARERAALRVEELRRRRSTVLIASHEDPLLQRLCDEIWWIRDGQLAGRGDPVTQLNAYRQFVAEQLRNTALGSPDIRPTMRRGNGRAEVVSIELIGEDGRPTMLWRSGELATVRVAVKFGDPVAEPVIGILIRTRIGLNVYGTNTELERLKMGPVAAGEILRIEFGFRCDLCPQEYTLTVASHDPDGVWHDWLEDAVTFSVTDSRYTAGVANLRATARFTLDRG